MHYYYSVRRLNLMSLDFSYQIRTSGVKGNFPLHLLQDATGQTLDQMILDLVVNTRLYFRLLPD
jgi:hypothetical protein